MEVNYGTEGQGIKSMSTIPLKTGENLPRGGRDRRRFAKRVKVRACGDANEREILWSDGCEVKDGGGTLSRSRKTRIPLLGERAPLFSGNSRPTCTPKKTHSFALKEESTSGLLPFVY